MNNTEYQCFKSDFPISVTNKSRKLIIECDEADLCSMKFNFNQKGNFAKITVNCLSHTGRQTPAHVNVKLFGGKAVLPIGIVYGSYVMDQTVIEGNCSIGHNMYKTNRNFVIDNFYPEYTSQSHGSVVFRCG